MGCKEVHQELRREYIFIKIRQRSYLSWGETALKLRQLSALGGILGSRGHAKKAQSEFLVLVEDAIRQPDLAKSVKDTSLPLTRRRRGSTLLAVPVPG